MFQNYPLVAFHDLCVRYLTGEGAIDVANIVPRLINVRHQLSSVEHQDVPSSYVTKLHLGVAWCTVLINMVTGSGENMDPASCLLTPLTNTDLGDCRPSSPVRHGTTTYWAGTNDQRTREHADLLEEVDSPDYFFDQELFEALFLEGNLVM